MNAQTLIHASIKFVKILVLVENMHSVALLNIILSVLAKMVMKVILTLPVSRLNARLMMTVWTPMPAATRSADLCVAPEICLAAVKLFALPSATRLSVHVRQDLKATHT